MSTQTRKSRLINQSELYRQDLQAEAENLRGTIEWKERGHVFYKAAGPLAKPFAPLASRKKNQNSWVKFLQRCAFGFRIWEKFSNG